MSILRELLNDIPIPQMVKIRQKFDRTILENPEQELADKLASSGVMESIFPDSRLLLP